jgi:hypothetical protein
MGQAHILSLFSLSLPALIVLLSLMTVGGVCSGGGVEL